MQSAAIPELAGDQLLSREEAVRRVQAGGLGKVALGAHDYVYDIFPRD